MEHGGIDYRYVNQGTIKDAYPLPRLDDCIETLGNDKAKIFSTLDVASGYWHIPLYDPHKEKTGFMGQGGQYQFTVVPFGLTGAPGIFCKNMTDALKDLLMVKCLVYVDDIVVWSETIDQHFEDLGEIFTRLQQRGFKLKLSKCEFFVTEMNYLGFIIKDGTVGLDPKRVESIRDFAVPTKKQELQSFLGKINWYARWIPHKGALTSVLTEMQNRNPAEWNLSDERSLERRVFEYLKKLISTYPVLRLPDFSKPFYVVTDASKYGVGAVLSQIWDDYEHPIRYFSKALKVNERRWPSYEKELYAVVLALREFHKYLTGREIYVVTDCRAVAHFNVSTTIADKHYKWLSEVSGLNVKFIHRPGVRMPVPDALSRDPRWRPETEEDYDTRKEVSGETTLEELMSNVYGEFAFSISKQVPR